MEFFKSNHLGIDNFRQEIVSKKDYKRDYKT